MVELEKNNPEKIPLPFNSPSKEAKQLKVAEKKANMTKGVALDVTKSPAAPQNPSKEKKAPPRMEIVLSTLPLPAKSDPTVKTKDPRK